MEANEISGLPTIDGGSFGFSTKAFTLRFSFTAMTPNSLASERGTSIQPTVHLAPLLT